MLPLQVSGKKGTLAERCLMASRTICKVLTELSVFNHYFLQKICKMNCLYVHHPRVCVASKYTPGNVGLLGSAFLPGTLLCSQSFTQPANAKGY